MLASFKQYLFRYYLRLIRNFKYFSRRSITTLKTPFAIASIVVFVLYISISYYGIDLLISLINDEEVASVIDLDYIVILLLFLATSLYFNFVLFIKIFIDRMRRSPGTLLRFRVIGFFFLSIIIPALVFIYVFDIFFDYTITIFDNQAIIRNMENKRWLLTQEVSRLTDQVSEEFESLKINDFKPFNESILTFIGVHELNGKRQYHFKKNNFSLRQVPDYPLDSYLTTGENFYSSYSMEDGFIYQVRLSEYQGKKFYFVVISKVGSYLMRDINETIAVIRQVKQFELLLQPFKLFTIIFLLYVYLQVFSILAIIFYYSSNRYISPLAALIKSTKQIIQGDYKLSLNRYIRYMENNEIKELLESFSKMSRELISSRQRLERLSSIEAWKDVSRKLAHEIKNPLTPIILATNKIEKQLMKSDLAGYDALKENFRYIESEVGRILNLLNEFNILAKQEFIKVSSVPSKRLTKKVADLLGHYNFISFEIEDSFQDHAMLDEEKMVSVILNLVQNSIESLQEVKKILPDYIAQVIFKIFTEKVSVGEAAQGIKLKNLVFEVWDNGKGISSSVSNKVFKPYVTFKKQGTGLGLAICEEIVSLHQGKIDHYSINVDRKIERTMDYNDSPIQEGELEVARFNNDKAAQEEEREGVNLESVNENQWTVFRVVIPIKG